MAGLFSLQATVRIAFVAMCDNTDFSPNVYVRKGSGFGHMLNGMALESTADYT